MIDIVRELHSRIKELTKDDTEYAWGRQDAYQSVIEMFESNLELKESERKNE